MMTPQEEKPPLVRMTREVKLIPPDGGWGWLIVLGSSLINLSTRAIEPSFGLLFGDLLRDLGVATTGASIIISTLDATINFSGLFVGPLVKRLTYRKVALTGALLSSTALFLTSMANSMMHIIITFSLIGGLGFGFATASTFVGLNSYFSKRKGQAVGLSMAGTALGFMTMPQIVSFLLTVYDFRSALFILSAFSLHSVVGALLFQPLKWHMKPDPDAEPLKRKDVSQSLLSSDNRERNLSTSSFTQPSGRLMRQCSKTGSNQYINKKSGFDSSPALHYRKTSVISNVSLTDLTGSSVHLDYDKTSLKDTIKKVSINIEEGDEDLDSDEQRKEQSCWSKFIELMDFDLLKDGVYLNILYGMSVCVVAEMNFKLIVPFFLGGLGYTKQEVAMSLSAMAIADIAARIVIPPILDRVRYSKRFTLIVGSIFVAVCRSVFAEQTETVPLLTSLVIHGFFRGFTLINFPLVLTEYSPRDKFPAVLGLSMVAKGIFIVVLGPVGGYIRDATGSYPICIHFQSALIMSMCVAWFTEYIFMKVRRKKKKNTYVSKSVEPLKE